MKAILKFDLPEDQEEFEQACKARQYALVLWELDQYLRSRIKYEDDLSEEQRQALQDTRDKLHDTLDDHDVSLD